MSQHLLRSELFTELFTDGTCQLRHSAVLSDGTSRFIRRHTTVCLPGRLHPVRPSLLLIPSLPLSIQFPSLTFSLYALSSSVPYLFKFYIPPAKSLSLI